MFVFLKLRLITVALVKANVGFVKLKDKLLEESNLTAWYTRMKKKNTEKVSFFHFIFRVLNIFRYSLSQYYFLIKIAQDIGYCLIVMYLDFCQIFFYYTRISFFEPRSFSIFQIISLGHSPRGLLRYLI